MNNLHLIFNKNGFERYVRKQLYYSYPSNPYLPELLEGLEEISLDEVKSFELDIAQLTQEDAQLLLNLLAFTSIFRASLLLPDKIKDKINEDDKESLLEALNKLSLQAAPYLNILPKIAAGEMSSAEAEHYMLRMLHRGQSRKNKRRLAKRLDNL